jgi:hypothetical protein
MGFIGHYVMMHEVTQVASKGAKPSIAPLVKYLETGKPFTDEVRTWLLALLSEQGHRGVRLNLAQTQGRPPLYVTDFEQELAAHDEYTSLCGSVVTLNLCEKYAEHLRTPAIRRYREKAKRGDKPGTVARTVYVIELSDGRNLRLKKGEPIEKQAALALVAAKLNRSPDALRKVLRRIDNAKEAQ